MSRNGNGGDAYMVTGPGEDERSAPSIGAGVSLALTFACRAKQPCSFYVRGRDGAAVARVDRDDDGVVRVPPMAARPS